MATRVDVKLVDQEQALIDEARTLQGMSRTGFLRFAGITHARQVIRENA